MLQIIHVTRKWFFLFTFGRKKNYKFIYKNYDIASKFYLQHDFIYY